MYAAGYHVPHSLRTMDPRSRAHDGPYHQPPPAWHMLAHAQYPDLPVAAPPQPPPAPLVPSPLSTPPNARDNSPVDYFAGQGVAQSQHEPWGMHHAHQRPSRVSLLRR